MLPFACRHTTIIVDPSKTTTTITVDEGAGGASGVAAAPTGPTSMLTFDNGMVGYVITMKLSSDTYMTQPNKLFGLQKYLGLSGVQMQVDDANTLKGYGVFASPEAWMKWNSVRYERNHKSAGAIPTHSSSSALSTLDQLVEE